MKVFILILVVYQQLVFSHDIHYTALKFGKDAESYIYIQPDFTPLTEAFTICSWVRRMSNHRSNRQDWLTYVGNGNAGEIIISDSARSYLLADSTSYTQPTLTTGSWNHMCHTWSFATRTKCVYYNGEQIGTETTPSGRKLRVPGSLMFGQYHYSEGSRAGGHYFGGELYDTNIFSTQLSAGQVKEMYTQGRCANYSQTFGDNTFLRWRDILLEDRKGSVTEVELEGCDTSYTHPEEEESTDVDEENTGIWQFLRSKNFHNQVISEEMLSDITDRMELLGEFLNHTIDDALISHLQKHHSDGDPGKETEEHPKEESGEDSEEEDSLVPLNAENWKFLTHAMFYNKVITEELLSNMTNRLELLAEFTGHRCDNALIGHLVKHHS